MGLILYNIEAKLLDYLQLCILDTDFYNKLDFRFEVVRYVQLSPFCFVFVGYILQWNHEAAWYFNI